MNSPVPAQTISAQSDSWLLIPDGLIPTTRIIESALRAALEPAPLEVALFQALEPLDLLRHRIVFSRQCDPTYAWVPAWLRKHGARYAYFIDDNFWAYRPSNPANNYYAQPEVLATLDAFIANASCVLATTKPLADAIARRAPNANIALVDSPFDFAAMPESRMQSMDGPLRVGFAGTERGSAFEPVVEAIKALSRERPGDFEFEFIGHVPETLSNVSDVKAFPAITDYFRFLEFKASRRWNVGLAPLGDSEFTRSKTNNKFREYGALQITGIYSDVTPYRETVTNAVDGLLVSNTHEAWMDALTWLADHRSECAAIGERARETIWERYRVDSVLPSWRTALDLANPAPARANMLVRFEGNARLFVAIQRRRLSAYANLMHSAGLGGLLRHICRRALLIGFFPRSRRR